MTSSLQLLASACFAAVGALGAIDFIASRRFLRPAATLLAGVVAFILLRVLTGYPTAERVSFGSRNLTLAIVVVLVGAGLGMLAHYLFYFRRAFSWLSLLRPLAISPLILAPLISTVTNAASLDGPHILEFGFLAFQNGFFWKAAFDKLQPQNGGV